MPSACISGVREVRSDSNDVPRKRVKLLLEDDTSSNSDSSDESGGVALGKDPSGTKTGLKINEEYARRFEHNQKRAELHRLEEKYGKEPSSKRIHGLRDEEDDEDDDSSTTSEEEDDEGVLALGILDEQLNVTLEAIRKKDPRVYDESVAFYSSIDDEDGNAVEGCKGGTKPMYLTDYHRKILLEGGITEDNKLEVATYVQQQDELKNTIVKEMHAAVEQVDSGNISDEHDANEMDAGFLVKKKPIAYGAQQSEKRSVLAPVDVENADKDPETFLSKFMATKAWVPTTVSAFKPFESDDEEEERRAEAFEEAYNLRFEDPQVSNEKLMSHARDTAAKYSVRKETVNGRKRAREAEQSKKGMEKLKREQEKARFRSLKIEEVEAKIKKIKSAAGLSGKGFDPSDWSAFLTEDWDDERWEAEMQKRFGDKYYAESEVDASHNDDEGRSKKKIKKPKWDDDIDITDLIPDFREDALDVEFSLSDDPDNDTAAELANMQDYNGKNLLERVREDQKREARSERRKIEQMVDGQINVQFAVSASGRNDPKAGRFRYRETSPVTYGLTAHDILMANDSQLNQYAGLKKLAPFRDLDKKRRDKKRLGKKARLRQWRKDTFGSEKGPTMNLQDVFPDQVTVLLRGISHNLEKETSKRNKRKRSKKSKSDLQ